MESVAESANSADVVRGLIGVAHSSLELHNFHARDILGLQLRGYGVHGLTPRNTEKGTVYHQLVEKLGAHAPQLAEQDCIASACRLRQAHIVQLVAIPHLRSGL